MFYINKLLIEREGYFGGHGRADPAKPLHCTIEIQGPLGKIEMNLPEDTSAAIIALVADKLGEVTRAASETMTQTLIEGMATARIEGSKP